MKRMEILTFAVALVAIYVEIHNRLKARKLRKESLLMGSGRLS